MMENKKIKFSSVEWRDGQQSYYATRFKTEDMLPILSKMDEVGYDSMEMWGGATFDVAIRYLNDDPWDRVKEFKKYVKKTPLRMLLRGQNLVGYTQYPDDIVDRFVKCAAEAGIDIFLIFDGLNDVRNSETCFKSVKKYGKRAEANICYTISPVHTIDKYIQMCKDYVSLGAEAIHIEDMAGMVTPAEISEVIRRLKQEIDVPIHFQAHCTGGMADICYWEAARAGADVLDCDVSSLSLGPAHPPLESIAVALKAQGYEVNMDLDLLSEINDYFKKLGQKYSELKSKLPLVDISVLKHQIPGGMLSNLEMQLKQMNLLDRIEEVYNEVHNVHKDFGYPPLATPFAQMVGSQAAFNVIMGERYKMISKESKEYIRGMYGRFPGPINEELKKNVLGDAEPTTVRPASLLAPGWDGMVTAAGNLARTEEDVLTYAMFPQIATKFLKQKYNLQ
jgi:pyruvate carboxylase subunit B